MMIPVELERPAPANDQFMNIACCHCSCKEERERRTMFSSEVYTVMTVDVQPALFCFPFDLLKKIICTVHSAILFEDLEVPKGQGNSFVLAS